MMRIAVVIPAHNADRVIAQCLRGCLDQEPPPAEIIVVDDGSTDNTAAYAGAFPVTVIRQPNAGPAAARNRGASAASADLIVFTDADCIPEPGWLRALEGAFENGVAAAGGTYGIANPASRLARIVHAEIRARHDRLPEFVDFLGSFNLACRRDAFEAVGGFDARFRKASAEDNDLAYRLAARGGLLRFVPGAVVRHHHPERLWPYLRTQAGHGYWRMLLYALHPGRARGDRYAGFFEMAGAPYAVALCALLPLVLALGAFGLYLGGAWPHLAAGYLLLAAALPLTHLHMALRMRRHAAASDALCFPLLASARDAARGLGMLRGAWDFMLRRKGLGA